MALTDHPDNPDVHGLMPGTHHSRDYMLPTIPCRCLPCAANTNGYCSMPSLISITAAADCETGLKYLKDTRGPIGSD